MGLICIYKKLTFNIFEWLDMFFFGETIYLRFTFSCMFAVFGLQFSMHFVFSFFKDVLIT